MATEAVPQDQANELRVELPQQRPPAPTELVVTTRPAAESIADPGPLGLACFALTTFVLSIFNAGVFEQTAAMKPVYLSIALVYGGVAQMLAGMWEFKKNNTFGAVAFTSYGAFWVSLALFVKFWGPAMKASAAGDAGYETALGIFLLSWTIFTAYMLVGSFRTNKALASVFGSLFVVFLLLVFGKFNQDMPGLTEWAGYLGIVTACLAWYTSAAGILNPMYGRTVLPTGPFKK